jgi:Ser/Thr protein kinase RdoA (MazF antagonist)
VDQPNTFIFNGWTASSFLSGAIEVGRDFEEVLHVCRTFHADLAELGRVKHAAIVSRSNRWDEADKVTWGEKKLNEVPGVDQTVLSYLNPILEKLVQAKEPLTERVELQFIHADLAENVLFQEDPKELPAIIDLTLYWWPARYAEAIIVADALTWNGKGRELIQYYGTDEDGRQLLVRALY